MYMYIHTLTYKQQYGIYIYIYIYIYTHTDRGETRFAAERCAHGGVRRVRASSETCPCLGTGSRWLTLVLLKMVASCTPRRVHLCTSLYAALETTTCLRMGSIPTRTQLLLFSSGGSKICYLKRDRSRLSKRVRSASTSVCEINTPFVRAVALRSSSRNSNPPPDLVLRKLILPRVSFSGGMFFSQTSVGHLRLPVGKRLASRAKSARICCHPPAAVTSRPQPRWQGSGDGSKRCVGG